METLARLGMIPRIDVLAARDEFEKLVQSQPNLEEQIQRAKNRYERLQQLHDQGAVSNAAQK